MTLLKWFESRIKKDWIMKALKAKKHVLCEKPVSIAASDYEELLAVAKEAGRYIMDGTMFVHNSRTGHLLEYISREAAFGKVMRINSEFTFRGDEDFFDNDIRTTKNGDPYGCIGDLGWYCVRLAQIVFKKVDCGTVTRAQTTFWELNEEGVPIDAQCMVFFRNEGADNDIDEQVLSFHCSFIHPLQQRVSIIGTKQSLEMVDYVIPREGSSSWCVHGQDLTVNDEYCVRSSDMVEVPCGSVQEVLMWRNFSKHCRAVERDGWQAEDANVLSAISLQNQKIVDALMESIEQNGKPIRLR
jgi:predicted dehydrogenase